MVFKCWPHAVAFALFNNLLCFAGFRLLDCSTELPHCIARTPCVIASNLT